MAQPSTKGKRRSGRKPSANEMRLCLPKKGKHGNLLLEIGDPKLNLSGDTGCIGRLKTTESKITLDMNGQIWSGPLCETATVMLVDMEPSRAQIEGIVTGVVRCKRLQNIFDFESRTGAKAKPMVFVHETNVNKDTAEINRSIKRNNAKAREERSKKAKKRTKKR